MQSANVRATTLIDYTSKVKRHIMMEQKKPDSWNVTLSGEKLKKYFPRSYTPIQIEAIIFKMLNAWAQQRMELISEGCGSRAFRPEDTRYTTQPEASTQETPILPSKTWQTRRS